MCAQQESRISPLNPGEDRMKLFQWNYEQCQLGYRWRDQMTNDIFHKMIQCFILYLGLLSLTFWLRTQRTGIVLEIFLVLLLIAGSLSFMFSWLFSLIS
jgi:hypothetical protein